MGCIINNFATQKTPLFFFEKNATTPATTTLQAYFVAKKLHQKFRSKKGVMAKRRFCNDVGTKK